MNQYRIEVRVTPREGLLDPEGNAVRNALRSLDFDEISQLGVGRLIRLVLPARTAGEAHERVDAMCRQLLANPVTEDYEILLENIS